MSVTTEELTKDGKIIEKWFHRHADGVYAYIAGRVCGDKQAAIDILQETFLEALKNINKYRPEKGSELTWLILLSKNHIKAAFKARQKFISVEEDNNWENLSIIFEKISDQPLPDEIIERKETTDLVRITLASLPAKYRELLHQFYYQQKKLKDIALENKQNVIAVKVRLMRARNLFKKEFLKLSKLGSCENRPTNMVQI
jgi:RNA polymerase sigma-70 factor (ECF subfamily)